jgi:hypothetical protein
MFARLLFCVLFAGVFGVASAQTSSAQPQSQQQARKQLTPQQRAEIQKRNKALVGYANSVVKMIDDGQEAQVWDAMSEVGKKAVTRDNFVRGVKRQRDNLGKVESRRAVMLYAGKSDGHEQLPAGIYMNVRYRTQFAKSHDAKIELVSFHLDGDRKWRVSGYVCKDMPKPAAQAAPKK